MKKRITTLVLAIVMLFNIIHASAAQIPSDNSSFIYNGENYRISYKINSSWSGNSNIEIKITNTSAASIPNWAVSYDAGGVINGLWNAAVYKQADTWYTLKNAGYNAEILPNQTVNFGYTLAVYDKNVDKFPKDIVLSSRRADKKDGFKTTLKVVSDWGNGFNGAVEIENTTDKAIGFWNLSFDKNFVIEDLWDGKIVSNSAASAVVSGNENTRVIPAKSKKTVNFRASKSSNSVVPAISNVALSEIVIGGDIPEAALETPLIAVTAEFQKPDILKFVWYANKKGGSFELLASGDDVNYTSVKNIGSETTLDYKITAAFEKKYFKIKQTLKTGQTAVSLPVIINKFGETYGAEHKDTDGDGLADYMEQLFGTDINKKDTDGDGINDYDELYITKTIPTEFDAGTTDSDNDGLTNLRELSLGTDPANSDTDGDGISDGDEVNKYGTNPLKTDTDDDGIPDNEEIAIGLDPTKAKTNGVPDNEYTFEQTLDENSKNFYYVNGNSENPFKVSLDVKAAGSAVSSLKVTESPYSNVIKSDAVLGVIPQFGYNSDCKVDDVTVKFDLSDTAAAAAGESDGTELSGIKKYNIFKYFEDINALLPVETKFDGNTLYAETDSLGTYCVIDMEKFLENITAVGNGEGDDTTVVPDTVVTNDDGTVTETYSASALSYGSAAVGSSDEENTKVTPDSDDVFNVVFVYDTRELIDTEDYDKIKSNIVSASRTIFASSKNAKIYLLKQSNALGKKDIDYDFIGVFTDFAELSEELDDNFSNDGEKAILSDAVDFLTTKFNASTPTYCFDIFDERDVYFREGTPSAENIENSGINISIISEISDDRLFGYAVDLFEKTGGVYIDNLKDFSNGVLEHIYGTVPETSLDYRIITSAGLKSVTLDQEITAECYEAAKDKNNHYNFADTDGDGLSDVQEIDINSPHIRVEDGKVLFPTFNEILAAKDNLGYVKKSLGRFNFSESSYKNWYDHVSVLPILSDPTSKDGDEDGIPDKYDSLPLLKNNAVIGDNAQFISDNETNYLTYSEDFTIGNCDFNSNHYLGADVQRYLFKPFDGGYSIRLKSDENTALSSSSNSVLTATSYDGSDRQIWYAETVGKQYTLVNKETGLYIHIGNGMLTDSRKAVSITLEKQLIPPRYTSDGVRITFDNYMLSLETRDFFEYNIWPILQYNDSTLTQKFFEGSFNEWAKATYNGGDGVIDWLNFFGNYYEFGSNLKYYALGLVDWGIEIGNGLVQIGKIYFEGSAEFYTDPVGNIVQAGQSGVKVVLNKEDQEVLLQIICQTAELIGNGIADDFESGVDTLLNGTESQRMYIIGKNVVDVVTTVYAGAGVVSKISKSGIKAVSKIIAEFPDSKTAENILERVRVMKSGSRELFEEITNGFGRIADKSGFVKLPDVLDKLSDRAVAAIKKLSGESSAIVTTKAAFIIKKYGDDVVEFVDKYGSEFVELADKYNEPFITLMNSSKKYQSSIIRLTSKYGDDFLNVANKYDESFITLMNASGDYSDYVIRLTSEYSDDFFNVAKPFFKKFQKLTVLDNNGGAELLEKLAKYSKNHTVNNFESFLNETNLQDLNYVFEHLDKNFDVLDYDVFGKNMNIFTLEDVGNFDSKALKHIFDGEPGSGFHYEGSPTSRGEIVAGTKTAPDVNGVYEAFVKVGGKTKQDVSSFFPKDWSMEKVKDAINVAYQSKQFDSGSTYIGQYENIRIDMYIDATGKITSAFPKYATN